MKTLIVLLLCTLTSFAESKKNDGRFQIVTITGSLKTTYLLDTQTGKMWAPICISKEPNSECKYNYWEPEDIVDITVNKKEVADRIKAALTPEKGQ